LINGCRGARQGAARAALLQARASPEFQGYIAKSELGDLSIGRPGEDFESAFTADMTEMRKIK
jgi:hypothetical protein